MKTTEQLRREIEDQFYQRYFPFESEDGKTYEKRGRFMFPSGSFGLDVHRFLMDSLKQVALHARGERDAELLEMAGKSTYLPVRYGRIMVGADEPVVLLKDVKALLSPKKV